MKKFQIALMMFLIALPIPAQDETWEISHMEPKIDTFMGTKMEQMVIDFKDSPFLYDELWFNLQSSGTERIMHFGMILAGGKYHFETLFIRLGEGEMIELDAYDSTLGAVSHGVIIN